MATITNTISIGLAEVQAGKASKVGFMPEDLQKIGRVLEDSCKISGEEPEKSEFFEENNPVAVASFIKKKGVKVEMKLIVDSLDILKKALGGTIEETSEGERWIYDSKSAESVAMRIISATKGGLVFNIPNASISGKLDSDLSAKGIVTVTLTATPQAVDTDESFYAEVLSSDSLSLSKTTVKAPEAGNGSSGEVITASENVSAVIALDPQATWVEAKKGGSGKEKEVTIKVSANQGAERSTTLLVVSGTTSQKLVVAQRGKRGV